MSREGGAPWLAIVVELESEPRLLLSAASTGDHERLSAWLDGSPARRAFALLAADVRDAERAARARHLVEVVEASRLLDGFDVVEAGVELEVALDAVVPVGSLRGLSLGEVLGRHDAARHITRLARLTAGTPFAAAIDALSRVRPDLFVDDEAA